MFNGLFVRFLLEWEKRHEQLKRLTLARRVHLLLAIATWIVARLLLVAGGKAVYKKYSGTAPALAITIESCIFAGIILGFEGYKWYSHMFRALSVTNYATFFPVDAQAILSDINSGMSMQDLIMRYPNRNTVKKSDKLQIHSKLQTKSGWNHSADAFAVLNRSCIGSLGTEPSSRGDTVVLHSGTTAATANSTAKECRRL